MDGSGNHNVPGIGFPGHLSTRVWHALKEKAERPRIFVEEAGPSRNDGQLDWRSEAGLMAAIKRATAFAERDLLLGGDAAAVAQDAVSGVWEDARFGRIVVDSPGAFQSEVSARLYKISRTLRNESRRLVRLDAPLGEGDSAATFHDAGWTGTHRATQINDVYLKEVKSGIERLPDKLASVMRLLSGGWNAQDIAEELSVPLHTVFHRIADARRALFFHDVIGMDHDL